MDPIRVYLADGALPLDFKEVDRAKRQANWFILYDGILYKRSYTRPLLCCMTTEIGKKILEKLYGVCNSHIGGRALAVNAIRTGYYWPSLRDDAMNLVRTCDNARSSPPSNDDPPLPAHQSSIPYRSPLGA